MKFKMHQPTSDLLAGLSGVELGASAHNRFGVNCINVAPVSGWDTIYFDNQQRKLGNEPSQVDLDGTAVNIPVEDNSVDFVLSSHVLEHSPNPIAAFLEWQRVIRPGGYAVMILPLPGALKRDNQPISTLKQLKAAYKRNDTYGEVDIPRNLANKMIHLWSFDMPTLKGMIASLCRGARGRPGLRWTLVGEESPDSKVGNGFWLAYEVNK